MTQAFQKELVHGNDIKLIEISIPREAGLCEVSAVVPKPPASENKFWYIIPGDYNLFGLENHTIKIILFKVTDLESESLRCELFSPFRSYVILTSATGLKSD